MEADEVTKALKWAGSSRAQRRESGAGRGRALRLHRRTYENHSGALWDDAREPLSLALAPAVRAPC
jgi:hypothetical protein